MFGIGGIIGFVFGERIKILYFLLYVLFVVIFFIVIVFFFLLIFIILFNICIFKLKCFDIFLIVCINNFCFFVMILLI